MNATLIAPATNQDTSLSVPAELVKAYAEVDAYQPVFGFESHFKERDVSRGCADRCEYLAKEFGDDVRNLRILDVGSSMGYLTLFFAKRGARTSGFDYNQPNIDFCKTLARIHGLSSDFTFGTFGLDYCRSLRKGRYDVVFLFSVLHHVVQLHGIEKTRQMMDELLDKTDTLYVELALKSENVPFPWKQSLPENELDIFSNHDSLIIEKMSDFPALGQTTIRPLYRVRRRSPRLNSVPHQDARIVRSAIKSGETRDRKYYVTGELFTKAFAFRNGERDTYSRYLAEVETYRRMNREVNFLPLLASGVEEELASITVPYVEGPSLMQAITQNKPLDIGRIGRDIGHILSAFGSQGLYWNDFRSHNLLLDKETVKAIDFEVAAPVEIENTLRLFTWLLCDLQHGKLLTQERNIFAKGPANVPPAPLTLDAYSSEIRPLVELALASRDLKEFAEGFRRSGLSH